MFITEYLDYCPHLHCYIVKMEVRQTREKSKPPKPNILKEKNWAIKSLQGGENIILLTDKGYATVVIDKVEFTNKFVDLISNDDYCKVKKDLTPKMERSYHRSLVRTKISYHKGNTDS